jgi:hypothetical protein
LVHQLIRGAAGQAGSGPVRDLPAGGQTPGVRQLGEVWEVRNLEPQESELEQCTPEEFANRLGVKLAENIGVSMSVEPEAAGSESRTGELWPWLWLGVVTFWLAEGLLANRTVA